MRLETLVGEGAQSASKKLRKGPLPTKGHENEQKNSKPSTKRRQSQTQLSQARLRLVHNAFAAPASSNFELGRQGEAP